MKRKLHYSKIAIKHGNKSISYAEWNNLSRQTSDRIISKINNASRTIGIYLPNSINYAVAYFGILFSNKIVVPIDIQAKKPEILSTIEYCEIDFIITDVEHCDYINQCLSEYRNLVYEYIIDTEEFMPILGDGDRDHIRKVAEAALCNEEEDVVIMLHTSGTTSKPKRVMLTNRNLITNVESNIDSLKLTENDKVLISLPMYFGYCNTAQFLTHLYLGAQMIIMDNIFLPNLFFQTVEKEKISNFTTVPSILHILLDYKFAGNYDFSSLRFICFGGGMMPVDKMEVLIEKYPSIEFIHTYGLTECAPRVTALLSKDSIRKIGSVGLPIKNVEINIVDKSDKPVKEHVMGEIVVRGNNVMKGYYKQPEITADTKRNGWLHTGDIGYRDEEGFYYITGRIKNIIISGGINIYPEEVEEVLMQYADIKEAYVYGKYDEMLGEIPVAELVIKSEELDHHVLYDFCRVRLAQYKIPRLFKVVESLEKTYNSKIKRHCVGEVRC